MPVGQQDESKGPGNGDAATEGPLQSVGSGDVEEVWDEDRIEKALKSLKEMHIQVSLCRLSILTVDIRLRLGSATGFADYHPTTHRASSYQAAITYAYLTFPFFGPLV